MTSFPTRGEVGIQNIHLFPPRYLVKDVGPESQLEYWTHSLRWLSPCLLKESNLIFNSPRSVHYRLAFRCCCHEYVLE